MPTLPQEKRFAVYGACALLGLGGSTLLINSLAMISQMIGRNVVIMNILFKSLFLELYDITIFYKFTVYFYTCNIGNMFVQGPRVLVFVSLLS